MSRSADLTASAGKKYTRYVRVVQPGACSRCAALAGIASSARAFKRHPACKCSSYPVQEDGKSPEGFHDSPEAYFDSLSTAEQDRVFTRAGAEAVRAGADVTSVVTARRGATGIQYGHAIGRETRANSGRQMIPTVIGRRADGSPIMGYTTSESTGRYGSFGKATKALGVPKRARLMPETIISLTDDPELRTTLLRDAGYIDFRGNTAQQRLTAAARDHQTASAFYRSIGLSIGG